MPRIVDALYAWEVDSRSGCGSAGVTDAPELAQRRFATALDAVPGPAEGLIRRVHVILGAKNPTYRHGRVLVRAHRDESGRVMYRPG